MGKGNVYCCGYDQPARYYELPAPNGLWKRYYFLDECGICGQTIGVLKFCNKRGVVSLIKRFKGERAIRLRDKIIKNIRKWTTGKGSKENQYLYYNNKGIIYNFNNRRVGKNEDFTTQSAVKVTSSV